MSQPKHAHAHGHVHDPAKEFDQALEVLKGSGLKLTRTRRALLEILLHEHGPFTIEQLEQKLGGSCDIATIYRNMLSFQEQQLVTPCDFGDGLIRYEWSHGGEAHHHHIICQNCGKVEELELCVVQELEKLVGSRGYTDVTHRLEFYGRCACCQA